MDLMPQPRPLGCFGSEFKADGAMCSQCQYRTQCKSAMGFRLNRIPVHTARFDFVPKILQTSVDISDPESNVHTLYHACHDAVFGKPGRFKIPSGGVEKIKAAAEEAECGLRLFMTAVMTAHTIANPSEHFYPNMLFGKSAIKRVNMYRTYCRETYGHFDIGSFNKLRKIPDDAERQMLSSEVLFGQMVVGYKMRQCDTKPYGLVYQLRESGFDTLWLATESTYVDILEKHAKGEGDAVSEHVSRLRHAVFQLKKSLKNNPVRAVETFRLRQSIMPMAIQQVLYHFGYTGNDFEIEDQPVVSPGSFWSLLGKAIHSHLLWLASTGDKVALSKLGKA